MLSREILLLIFLKGVVKLSFLLLIFEYRKRLISLEKGGAALLRGDLMKNKYEDVLQVFAFTVNFQLHFLTTHEIVEHHIKKNN